MTKRKGKSSARLKAKAAQQYPEPGKRHEAAPELAEGSAPTLAGAWSPTTVTTKGQVTIPKRIRDHLGVAAGSAVQFEIAAGGEVVLRCAGKITAPSSRFDRLLGTATAGLTTDEIMAMTRGDD
jgi:antitoxin PrlF